MSAEAHFHALAGQIHHLLGCGSVHLLLGCPEPQVRHPLLELFPTNYYHYVGGSADINILLHDEHVRALCDAEMMQHPLSYFVHMLLAGKRPLIRGAANEARDHIFIDDVVRANLCALERGQNQTLHISSGQGFDLRQFYRAAADLLHSEIEPLYMTGSSVIGSSLERSVVALDNQLAWRALGWRPEVDFSEGVRRAVERLWNKQVEQKSPLHPLAIALV